MIRSVVPVVAIIDAVLTISPSNVLSLMIRLAVLFDMALQQKRLSFAASSARMVASVSIVTMSLSAACPVAAPAITASAEARDFNIRNDYAALPSCRISIVEVLRPCPLKAKAQQTRRPNRIARSKMDC